MSLFGRLIRLRSDQRCPLEDFHTEIVASVLANDSMLTLAWIRELGITKILRADKIAVTTQVSFGPIEGIHDVGSRPDIVINISGEGRHEIIFVESKVGSPEGNGQLQKYIDHLSVCKAVDRRTLVFITRGYEPKEDLANTDVQFLQTRWFEFHRFLNARKPKSDTTRELLQFMKENNMSQANRFTAIDLIALTNHGNAQSLMEATLGERIAERFMKLASIKLTRLDRFNRLIAQDYSKGYTMYGWPTGSSHQIGFAIGYWFPNEQMSDSPKVGMKICVDPGAPEYGEIEQAMRKFAKASVSLMRDWVYHDTDSDWEGLECTVNLESFFATEDHVVAIRTWFFELMNDVDSFRNSNPELPWLVA